MIYYVYKYKLDDSDNWQTMTFEHKGCSDETVKGWLDRKFPGRVTAHKKQSERDMPDTIENRAGAEKSSQKTGKAGFAALRKRLKE